MSQRFEGADFFDQEGAEIFNDLMTEYRNMNNKYWAELRESMTIDQQTEFFEEKERLWEKIVGICESGGIERYKKELAEIEEFESKFSEDKKRIEEYKKAAQGGMAAA